MTGMPAAARDVWTYIVPGRPDVPVIMITAYGDAETRRKAIEQGAVGLLTKPIDFALLRHEIDTRLGQAA